MKLSLTFEPFVKPQYKQFCIDTIQTTVNQIKHHFKFSLKQHIYQDTTVPQNKNKNTLSKLRQDAFSKTLRKEYIPKLPTQDEDLLDNTQNVNFFHLDSSPKSHPKPPQTKPQSVQQPCKLIQQQELIGFLQKVQTALAHHTSFYKKIMEKIAQMNEKQLYLEQLTSQLKALKLTHCQSPKTSHFIEDFDLLTQEVTNHDHMTFRDNQFILPSQNNQKIADVKTKKCHRLDTYGDIDSTCKSRICCQSSPNHSSSEKSSERSHQSKFSCPTGQNNKNNDFDAQNQANSEQNGFDLSGISQNADFLISFMKLEQQYNKIKRKTQFKSIQESSQVPVNNNPFAKHSPRSKMQLTYVH